MLSGAIIAFCFWVHELARGDRLDILVSTKVGFVTASASLTLLLSTVGVVVGSRALFYERVRLPFARMLMGAFEGAVLGCLVFVVQWYASFHPSDTRRIALLTITIASTALWATKASQAPRLSCIASIAVFGLGALVLHRLPLREPLWVHVTLLLVLSAAGARALATFLPTPALPLRPYFLSAFLLFVISCSVLGLSSAVRATAYQTLPSTWTFVRAATYALRAARPLPENALSKRCPKDPSEGDLLSQSQKSGSLPSADLLILSVDAWRWDHAFAMRDALAALGPHVRFTRAVAPSTHTMISLSSVVRGTPARNVPLGRNLGMIAPTPNASRTLGQSLSDAGYRAVLIPTHRFFDPRLRLDPGFEVVRVDERPLFQDDPGGSPTTVPQGDVLARALKVARRTTSPLALWAHLMEGHAPYLHNAGKGPLERAGQLMALRDLSKAIAAFLPRYRALRKGRPLIVVLFGDHGEEFEEHGGTHHGATAFAELARVGFAMSAPGITNQTIDAPVSLAALTPTLLDLLGLPRGPDMTMRSLLPCIETRTHCPTVAATEQLREDSWLSYTTATHRLVKNTQFGLEMLFDTARDPYDQRALSGTGVEERMALADTQKLAATFDAAHCLIP